MMDCCVRRRYWTRKGERRVGEWREDKSLLQRAEQEGKEWRDKGNIKENVSKREVLGGVRRRQEVTKG